MGKLVKAINRLPFKRVVKNRKDDRYVSYVARFRDRGHDYVISVTAQDDGNIKIYDFTNGKDAAIYGQAAKFTVDDDGQMTKSRRDYSGRPKNEF